jgi:hypothetical protein
MEHYGICRLTALLVAVFTVIRRRTRLMSFSAGPGDVIGIEVVRRRTTEAAYVAERHAVSD